MKMKTFFYDIFVKHPFKYFIKHPLTVTKGLFSFYQKMKEIFPDYTAKEFVNKIKHDKNAKSVAFTAEEVFYL